MNEAKQETTINTQQHPRVVRVLANIASYVFHPVLFASVMSIVVYALSPMSFPGISRHDFGKWLAIIMLNTLFFPLVLVLLLKGLGFLKSIQMRDSKERIVPLMGNMVFYFWATHVFSSLNSVPVILKTLLLANFWGVILVFMANIFTKVSLHTTAAGGMLGILTVLMMVSPVSMMVPLFVGIVIAGIIGTARMVLGAHQRGDIWLGYIIGFGVQWAAYAYLK